MAADDDPTPRRVRIIGPGRAGGAFAAAIDRVGWEVVDVLGRAHDPTGAARDVDLVLITTPDAVVASVAAAIEPADACVAHVAGSLDLDAVQPHLRRGSLHPLMSLPDAMLGAERLLGGAWFATAGDAVVAELAEAFGGRRFAVADADRARYHAIACVASNHLVALLGQVERLASSIGIPREAYLDLAAASLDNTRRLGAAPALTGPAARGDEATLSRHRAALPPDEVATYDAMVHEARRLAGEARRHDR